MFKSFKRFTLLWDYLSGNTICKAGPLEIGIEVTNRCNLDCIMCPRKKMTRPLGDMSFDLFTKIIDSGRDHLEFVWLQDYGESFLNSAIFEMINYCRKNGIRTGISTNATLLDKNLSERILTSGLDYLIFGFDGVTKETYENVRKGANYEKVVNNIRQFLEKKTKMETKIFTVLQCICMKETEEEIKKFKKLWKIPGVDAIRIRQVTFGIEPAKEKDKKFVNPKKGPCYWLWSNPHIKWNGTMVPCCQDVNAIYPLGNINKDSLFELWNSERMVELRKTHLLGEYRSLNLCKDCNMYQPSALLVIGSSFFNLYTVNRLVPRMETKLSLLRYR